MKNIKTAEQIKQIRLNLGETMEKFGQRFNTSKGTVNNWEKGRNLPNKENLLKIANLGEISVERLLSAERKNPTLEMMIGWLDGKIELNDRMIAADKKLSDFEIFLMADNEMMEKIKEELLK